MTLKLIVHKVKRVSQVGVQSSECIRGVQGKPRAAGQPYIRGALYKRVSQVRVWVHPTFMRRVVCVSRFTFFSTFKLLKFI